ncbi:MAG: hypothetical protein AAGE13_15580 [Pseudomonadota bacterium]
MTLGAVAMESCPNCGMYTYAWGICTNDSCNYPALRSNTELQHDRAQAAKRAQEARRAQEAQRAQEAKRAQEARRVQEARAAQQRKAAQRQPSKPKPQASLGEILEGIGILALTVGGAAAGYTARPDAPAGLLVGAGIGLAVGLATRRLLRYVVAGAALLAVLAAIGAVQGR